MNHSFLEQERHTTAQERAHNRAEARTERTHIEQRRKMSASSARSTVTTYMLPMAGCDVDCGAHRSNVLEYWNRQLISTEFRKGNWCITLASWNF